MTTFSGPVKTKEYFGESTIGQLLCSQTVTLAGNTSGASSIRLPARAQVTDMNLVVTVSGSGNTEGLACRIGTSADVDFFGTIVASVIGIYRAGVARNLSTASGASWKVGANNTQLHIDVTGQATTTMGTDSFEGIFTIFYTRNDVA